MRIRGNSRWSLAAVAALAAALLAPASALAARFDPELDLSRAGQVRLSGQVPAGTVVVATEQFPGAQPVTVTQVKGQRPPTIATWTCGRVTRRFTLQATLPDGASVTRIRSAKQPPCSGRLQLELLDRPRPGSPVRVRVRDTFRLGGFTARVCLDGPNGPDTCREVVFGAGSSAQRAELGKAKAGRSLVIVKAPFAKSTQTSFVARRAGGFKVLATGDSMIQIVDQYLAGRLKDKGGRVVSDAHISTGISKPAMLNWPRHAKGSAASVKPDVTVVFLGANDGFPFGSAACCGDAWSGVYADRVAGMMRTYLRGGKGRVIWLLLPAPRGGNFATVFRGVNDGIQRAAARFRQDEVTVLDLRKTFTPGGGYRGSISWEGRSRQVRQSDGVHLNNAGAAITADLITRQLRADGFIG